MEINKFIILFITICLFLNKSNSTTTASSFYIENGKFLINDGSSSTDNEYQIISGSFHYFRSLPEVWSDRLQKVRACGLNSIQTYIPWNLHQPNGLSSDLVGIDQLIEFLKLAQENQLNVILRPGPYICAEYENGGLPYWLNVEDENIAVRSSDPTFLSSVQGFWSKLLPLLEPLLYTNGGPIIMVQVENEYGSYGADTNYLEYLLMLLQKYLGTQGGNRGGVLFHSTDGPSTQMLYGSKLPGVYQTVDFGPNTLEQIQDNFKIQQQFTEVTEMQGPSMNSEYYTGWITHWTESSEARTDPTIVANGLDIILSLNASVNMYMFFGGTNFGYSNGANSNSEQDYEITIQSYDYDSPISESGDTNDKYYKIKQVIEKYIPGNGNNLPPVPANSTKVAYGTIEITQASSLFDNLKILSISPPPQLSSGSPKSMEQLNQATGFILYETIMNTDQSNQITLNQLHDRATIYVNNQLVQVDSNNSSFLQRPYNNTIEINYPPESGDFTLSILLENQGRVNFGPFLNDKKGILGGVTSSNQLLGPWNNYPLPLGDMSDNVTSLFDWVPIQSYSKSNSPTFYFANLTISSVDSIGDTFLSFNGIGKGQLFVNGFNVGRYWNVAPQRTIYIPSALLIQGNNEIILFETLLNSTIKEIQFLDEPIFD